MTLKPERMLSDLIELRTLTGNEDGAQRLAWTPIWDQARKWLLDKLSSLPVETCLDEAGNIWACLPGKSSETIILGSHIDSVPNGGWLDGCLGVAAGLEVLRNLCEQGVPPMTVRLVAWAEEEGTQFGQSLFTASLTTGSADLDHMRALVDRNGDRLVDVIGRWGLDLETAGRSRRYLDNAAAYLELHIEQGPVLEHLGLPLAAVEGAMGIERHSLTFSGQTAHAGSTPMPMRKDALAGAARFALAVREIAVRHGGVGTVGSVVTRPGIVTAVAGEAICSLDMRHLDSRALAQMINEAKESSLRIANEENLAVNWQTLYRIAPTAFHPELIDLCAAAVKEVSGVEKRMPSGPLHDAVEMARVGIPTAMLFVQSLRGLSHTKEENTHDEDLLLAARAFFRLTEMAMQRLQENKAG